ncbi:MAG: C4-type zinc ribbon domain-containing protein [Bacteroidales bacterium]|nr:C4-type zinc ribbon domain-containing protein [Bacteroidales bacterium]MDD3910590.1 C4-type zinc ribbon domain-containing protein [Bacteroidales bacterium]MDD4420483.1 C4-type zinc ribbon domain-containing protein [Bacteroidales bacterium]
MATKQAIKTVSPKVVKGETFVSLQISKNLDPDSMEKKLKLLYELQKTDSRIDKIYMLRGELPLEVQDLEDEILGHKAKIASLAKEVKDIEAFIASKKQDIVGAKAAIKKYEQQRNNVKNNREFDSLSKEIEYQELDSQLSEKKIADNTKILVERKEIYNAEITELTGRQEDLANKKKELDGIVKETEREEKDLLKQSEEIQSQIDPRMLAAYEKVRSNARNKMAVVKVVRGACGGCFNKIPPQRQIDIESSKRIIVCEYCGRILVSEKFDEEEGKSAPKAEAPIAKEVKKSTKTSAKEAETKPAAKKATKK